MTRNIARVLAALATIGGIVALTACSHATPGGPSGATTAGDDDPWISRGSVSAGPVYGNPVGPYSPRQ